MADEATNYAGDTIRAAFAFEYGDGVRVVTAPFAHESDPDRIIRPVNRRPPERHAPLTSGMIQWKALLFGEVGAGDAAGVYRCVSLTGRYKDGSTADFGRLPHQTIEITKRNRQAPSGVEWARNAT